MKNLQRTLWLSEFALALLIITGVADATMAYITLFVLIVGIWKLSDLDALRFYIYSIPIFVALPPSSLSEAMSVWRFALLFFVFKIFLEKFEIISTMRKKELTLAGKKDEILARGGSFVRGVRSSNYFEILTPTLAFGVVGLLTLLVAESVGAGIKKLIFLGSVFLLFSVVYYAVKKKEDVMKVLRSVFVTGLGIMAVGYFQLIATFGMTLSDFWGVWDKYVIQAFYGEHTMILLSYSNTWFSYYGSDEIPATLRMFSVMQDSHSFSILMIIFLPLALFYAYSARNKSGRNGYLAIYLLMMLALWFSGSRGAWVGWLGAVVSAAYFCIYAKIPEKIKIFRDEHLPESGKLYKTVLLAAFSFLIMFPVSNFVLSENQNVQLIREGKMAGLEKYALLKRTWSISDMDETSNKGRLEIWRDSAVSFINHPLTGIGIGNFPLALSEKVGTAKIGASAHNIYLDIAVEMGVFGLLLFLLLLWRISGRLFRLSQKLSEGNMRLLAGAFLVSFIWIAAYGLFDVVIWNDKVLMFVVILTALLYRTEAIESTEKSA